MPTLSSSCTTVSTMLLLGFNHTAGSSTTSIAELVTYIYVVRRLRLQCIYLRAVYARRHQQAA